MFTKRRLLVFFIDVYFIAFSYTLAFLLRFDFSLRTADRSNFFPAIYVVLIVKPLVFLSFRLYRSIWRYASLPDAIEIFKAVSLSSVLSFFALFFSRQAAHFSRAIFVMDWIILFGLMAASRLLWRAYRETYIMPRKSQGPRTLIVGAGEAGSMLIKEIGKLPEVPYDVVGYVDDDPRKQGMRLHGIPVVGDTGRLSDLIHKHRAEKVIIAIPSASQKAIRAIVHSCESSKVRCKILPGLSDIISGNVSVSQIKDVEIEDLLGREPVVLDDKAIRGYLTDKTVMVTGAAGSIGSELCRQIVRFKPFKLIILDSAETALFYIERELTAHYPDLRLITVMGDIRNQQQDRTALCRL